MKVTSEQLLDLFGLKVGDIVRVSMELGTTDFVVIKYENGWYKLRSKVNGREYRDNISFLLDKDFEIIKPKPKLSEDEKVILRNLPIEYKGYIARYHDTHCDRFSILIACKTKPIKDNDLGVWVSNDDFTILPYDHLFTFITWEDEEPHNIEELLKGNE